MNTGLCSTVQPRSRTRLQSQQLGPKTRLKLKGRENSTASPSGLHLGSHHTNSGVMTGECTSVFAQNNSAKRGLPCQSPLQEGHSDRVKGDGHDTDKASHTHKHTRTHTSSKKPGPCCAARSSEQRGQ